MRTELIRKTSRRRTCALVRAALPSAALKSLRRLLVSSTDWSTRTCRLLSLHATVEQQLDLTNPSALASAAEDAGTLGELEHLRVQLTRRDDAPESQHLRALVKAVLERSLRGFDVSVSMDAVTASFERALQAQRLLDEYESE